MKALHRKLNEIDESTHPSSLFTEQWEFGGKTSLSPGIIIDETRPARSQLRFSNSLGLPPCTEQIKWGVSPDSTSWVLSRVLHPHAALHSLAAALVLLALSPPLSDLTPSPISPVMLLAPLSNASGYPPPLGCPSHDCSSPAQTLPSTLLQISERKS